MKQFAGLALLTFVAGSVAVFAQDPVKVAPTHYKVIVDNAAVRVLRVDYAPGEKAPMHSHPDAMIVSLGASKVRFTMADNKTQDSDMAANGASYTPAGSHASANIGTSRAEAIVVEFKTAAPGKATLPASRPGMTISVLAEGPRAIAYKTTAEPTFSEPAGSKHDFDQVVIATGAAQMSLSINGQPAKTSWAKGDAVFIGRGVAHEAKNTGGKPVDFMIVAIK